MDVILLVDIDPLGKAGDVIKVKDGYARNLLIPKKKAIPCTKGNRNIVEEQKRLVARRKEKEVEKFSHLAEKISSISCTIRVQAGEEDKLFGSVTNADIQEALAQEGIELDKRKINLEEPIKKIGIYTVEVELHPEVKSTLKVWVVKE